MPTSPNFDLVIEGRFVNPKGMFEGYVGINNGMIEKISLSSLSGREKVKAGNGCLVFPGFIDIHVHLREDGSRKWTYKEDFGTGTRAAIRGGVTCVVDMPNTPETGTTLERIKAKKELANKKANIDVLFYGGVARDNIGELETMAKEIVGYKAFVCESTGKMFISYRELEEAMHTAIKTKLPLTVHCEDQSIINANEEIFKDGDDPTLHASIRSEQAEIEAVSKVLALKKSGLHLNIAHVSTSGAIELIKRAKQEAKDVTCEVTPHHIFFTIKDMKDKGPYLKMNPPLRSDASRSALLQAIKEGVVDFLASDHAPHTMDEKEQEWQIAPSGVPNLDTYGMVVAWLIRRAYIAPETIARITSYNPALFLGLENAGKIDENYLANLTILDLKKETQVSNDQIYSKCGWTPFEGYKLPGCVKHTIVKGEVLSHYDALFL